MKRVLILAISIFWMSCGNDRQVFFEVENEIDFVIPGGLNSIETHVFVIRNVPTFFQSSLTANGATASQIASISAARARVIGKFDNVRYDFIEEISVRAISTSDRSLNKEMFFQDRIPFNHSGDLELFSSISELVDILSETVIDIEVRVRLRTSTALTIDNKLIFSYVVFEEE